ncbi:MAG: deoxyribose-phosphate aldolase [Coriobacteriia bacterium]|nr:deoxyribose-phosphate aldolase [Coriobacteriia bacterium]MCL2536733.1 deoxyribose-phosphate aldolase [Coriobacteriia bacterium]
MNLNKFIDHTNLAVNATELDIRQLCAEALEYDFAAVCVNPIWVKLCADLLRDSEVKVCTVIGFPTGAHMPEAKLIEAQVALVNGAQELDTVINIAALRAEDIEMLRDDIEPLADAAHAAGAILKVILETALLEDDEIVRACNLCWDFGADFVKTSTGMLLPGMAEGGQTGASLHAVGLMARHAAGASNQGVPMGVKASGGIRDRDTAIDMIEAGATRIGTSSGIPICTCAHRSGSSGY